MCDCYTPQGVPIPTNKRNNAAKIFDNPKVAAEVTWYEYFYPDFKFLSFSCSVVSVMLLFQTYNIKF
jgi:hypothetical protein